MLWQNMAPDFVQGRFDTLEIPDSFAGPCTQDSFRNSKFGENLGLQNVDCQDCQSFALDNLDPDSSGSSDVSASGRSGHCGPPGHLRFLGDFSLCCLCSK